MGINLPSIASDGRVGMMNSATGRIEYQKAQGSPNLLALRMLSSLLPVVASSLSAALTRANTVTRTYSPQVLGDPSRANAAREALLAEIRAAGDAARQVALTDISSIRVSMEAFTKGAEKDIAAQIFSRTPTNDINELLLRETRESRAWARTKPILDNAGPKGGVGVRNVLTELVTTAASNSDMDTIAALFAELPAWCMAQGEVFEVLAFDIENALIKAIPEKADAIRSRQELKKGINHLAVSLFQFQHAVETSQSGVITVDWEGKSQPLTIAADAA
jgi:hypothetical protein